MITPTAIALPRIAFLLVCGALALIGLPASEARENASAPAGFTYRPDNVHRAAKTLPDNLRRVAVLPLAGDLNEDLTEGRESLGPILIEELAKTKKFEVVRVDPDALKRATGQPAWTGEERLPANLLTWLTNTYACDAVLVPQLTTFRAYAPLAVGWRFKLVDTRTGDIIWSTDEVFDAGQPAVITGAKRYNKRETGAKWTDDGWAILRSPRRFGRYSAATLLALLPDR